MDDENETSVENSEEEPIAGIGTMVFGKWDATEVICADPGISPYVNLKMIGAPHTGGRHSKKRFGKPGFFTEKRFEKPRLRKEKGLRDPGFRKKNLRNQGF